MKKSGGTNSALEALSALRQFLKSRRELRDETLFLTSTPPSSQRIPESAKPRQVSAPRSASASRPSYATPSPRPQYAFKDAGSTPRQYAPPRGPGRAAPAPVERHKSGIISAGSSEKGRSLLEFYEKIRDCKACPLGATRLSFVFGCGNPESSVVFVGEAPGEHEDRQGLPFVGLAGQLLTRMMASVGIPRDSIFICNILKCRPPKNRPPEISEIEECEPYLTEQLKIIKPRFVVALGTFAAQSLLRTQKKISQLRGRFYSIQGNEIMPTFHPSACLRSPAYKKELEADLYQLKARLQEAGGKDRRA